MAEQYLTLAGKTDAAFRALVEYLRVFDEPTIVVMFGDHQPSVEQGFLDLAYGVTQEQMTMEQYMGKYYVPFVIWANYPCPGRGRRRPASTSWASTSCGTRALRHPLRGLPVAAPGGAARPHLRGLYGRGGPGLQPSGDQRFHRPD